MIEGNRGSIGMTRRDLLRRGLKIGGAVWAVPVVQVLNMAPAEAHGYNSPRPSGPGQNGPSSPSGPSSVSGPSNTRRRR